MKKLLGLSFALLSVLVVIFAASFWWVSDQFERPGPLAEEKIISIERGAGLTAIANTLHREGTVNHPYVFIIGTRLLDAQGTLKAGEYELAAHMSPHAIMDKLRKGETFARRVTVREGLTSFETTRLIGKTENLSGEIKVIPAEGTLLPGTYDYQQNEPREKIIERMQGGMDSLLLSACKILLEDMPGKSIEDRMDMNCAAPAPLKTVRDVLTLASIVEKETGVAEERARVAGVFLNRLAQGIPLQTDPTVIYAITKGAHKDDGQGPLGRRLLSKDLEIDSPYNTYKYPGLPPGPIANPGKASIEAVLAPEKHDFIYFVADGSGGHLFARSLDEHNRNVAAWRKTRKAQEAE